MLTKKTEKKGGSTLKRFQWVIYGIMVLMLIGGIKAYDLYKKAFAENITIEGDKPALLLIQSDWNYDSVKTAIRELDIVKNFKNLEWTMEKKNYPNNINPGRYLISKSMNNSDFVDKLRAGHQDPIALSFNNVIYLEDFCERVGEQLELNSDELLAYLQSEENQEKLGFNKYTINCMFIPNTYEVYWNISVVQFVNRMQHEYKAFWNTSREKNAEAIGLEEEEVIILASIVNAENLRNADEWRRIAGVYMNRLNNSWPLQADPTLSYANNITVKRHLNKDKKVDSPYNTYKVKGLPPGPIRFPDIGAIDAVLNYERHKFFFMVASTSKEGYHEFNQSLSGHNKDKRLYTRDLDKKGIKR